MRLWYGCLIYARKKGTQVEFRTFNFINTSDMTLDELLAFEREYFGHDKLIADGWEEMRHNVAEATEAEKSGLVRCLISSAGAELTWLGCAFFCLLVAGLIGHLLR